MKKTWTVRIATHSQRFRNIFWWDDWAIDWAIAVDGLLLRSQPWKHPPSIQPWPQSRKSSMETIFDSGLDHVRSRWMETDWKRIQTAKSLEWLSSAQLCSNLTLQSFRVSDEYSSVDRVERMSDALRASQLQLEPRAMSSWECWTSCLKIGENQKYIKYSLILGLWWLKKLNIHAPFTLCHKNILLVPQKSPAVFQVVPRKSKVPQRPSSPVQPTSQTFCLGGRLSSFGQCLSWCMASCHMDSATKLSKTRNQHHVVFSMVKHGLPGVKCHENAILTMKHSPSINHDWGAF